MGLDTDFDCWSGAYSRFHRFRQCVARAAGIELLTMEGFTAVSPTPWSTLPPNPLWVLLNHSDCDGTIEHRDCLPIAQALREIAEHPELDAEDFRDRCLQFAEGLARAHYSGKPVRFH